MNQNTDQFFVYDHALKELQQAVKADYFRSKKLNVQTYQSVFALPSKSAWQNGERVRWGGILDLDRQFIPASGRYRNEAHTVGDDSMAGGYEFNPNLCPVLSGEYIYCGEWLDHWGHFLLECTTRLWWVVRHRRPNQKLIFLTRERVKIRGNFKEFFELLGIDAKDIILIEKPTKIQTLIIPDCSSVLRQYYTSEFMEPFHKINEGISASPEKRIYLSRRKCKIRYIMGEERLEHLFRQNGFTIVYPERLSLKRLLSLFKNAEYIAGLSGSSMHNSVFASPKTKLIILNRFSAYNPAQGLINQAVGSISIYVDAHFNFLPVCEEPYLMGLTPPLREFCKSVSFDTRGISKPTTKEIRAYFERWLTLIPKQAQMLTTEEFQKAADVMKPLFTQMSSVSIWHQRMDIGKYTILSKLSWGVHKKKYLAKLNHYREKYAKLNEE